MPTEVYSISGAATNPCPEGWAATPNGNCGAPLANCPADKRVGNACRSIYALALQNALRSLGLATRDAALSSLTVDGFIGPQTVAATNRAFTQHIGSGQAPADVRTGQLSLHDVAAKAQQLAVLVATELTRRGAPLQQIAPAAPSVPATQTAARAPAQVSSAGGAFKWWALVGLSALFVGLGLWGVWGGRKSTMPRGSSVPLDPASV